MLICRDELRRISLINKRRTQMFENLEKDVKAFEAEDIAEKRHPDHENSLSAVEKVQTALRRLTRQNDAFERLFEDISMSLSSV